MRALCLLGQLEAEEAQQALDEAALLYAKHEAIHSELYETADARLDAASRLAAPPLPLTPGKSAAAAGAAAAAASLRVDLRAKRRWR